MEILVYSNKDIKKDGKLKIKNTSRTMMDLQFKQYVKDNALTLSSDYIDWRGFLSNGLMFRCSYNGIVIGVSGIIKEIKEAV